jgi:hypothetical protein
MSAATATVSMPQFRTKLMLRIITQDLRHITKIVARTERDVEKQLSKVEKQAWKTEASRPGSGARARAEEKLARERATLDQIRGDLDHLVATRHEHLTRLQAIEALPEEPANYVPVDTEEKYSQEDREPAEVSVRMMNGDLFSVEIDLNDEIHFFPKQFVREAGYNPAAVSRMVFFVDNEDEPLIDPDQPWYVRRSRPHYTWKERFANIPNPDALPMLNLFIRPDSEKDRDAKIALIRQILEQKKLDATIDDTELYSQYSEWNLRYQPSGVSNRYITMSAFVEQNHQLFPVLTEEEIEAAKEHKEHRRLLEEFRDYRERQLRWIEDNLRVHGDNFNQPRLAAQERLRQFIAINGTEVAFNLEQNRYFRRWMSIQDIVDMGVRSENICACSHPNCFISSWTRLSTELEAL